MAIHQEDVLRTVKVKKKQLTAMMNIYTVMISIGYILQWRYAYPMKSSIYVQWQQQLRAE